MSIAIIAIHILACVGLVLIVLLQAGKGASMGAAFGGSSQTVFGSTGASSFLAKATTAVAVIFMLTSLGLAVLGGPSAPPTVMQEKPAATSAPATAPSDKPAAAVPAPAQAPAPAAEKKAD